MKTLRIALLIGAASLLVAAGCSKKKDADNTGATIKTVSATKSGCSSKKADVHTASTETKKSCNKAKVQTASAETKKNCAYKAETVTASAETKKNCSYKAETVTASAEKKECSKKDTVTADAEHDCDNPDCPKLAKAETEVEGEQEGGTN